MPTEADRARARRILERIKSARVSGGRYSVYGRAKLHALESIAAAIAANNPSSDLNETELTRHMQRQEARNPAAFLTQQEVSASVQGERFDEMNKKTVVRDVTTSLLQKLSPTEKLNYVNNNGELPRRFMVLKDD
jgi:hypothetical protein